MATLHTATAREGTPRAEEWLNIFGSRTIYLVTAEPVKIQFPDDEQGMAFLLDVPSLKDEQRTRLVEHTARKFQIDAGLVERVMNQNVFPIRLGDDLVIATQQPLTDGWV